MRALMQRINATPINTLRPCLRFAWVLLAEWYQPSASKLLCLFNWSHAGHPWLMASYVRDVGTLCNLFCIDGTCSDIYLDGSFPSCAGRSGDRGRL